MYINDFKSTREHLGTFHFWFSRVQGGGHPLPYHHPFGSSALRKGLRPWFWDPPLFQNLDPPICSPHSHTRTNTHSRTHARTRVHTHTYSSSSCNSCVFCRDKRYTPHPCLQRLSVKSVPARCLHKPPPLTVLDLMTYGCHNTLISNNYIPTGWWMMKMAMYDCRRMKYNANVKRIVCCWVNSLLIVFTVTSNQIGKQCRCATYVTD